MNFLKSGRLTLRAVEPADADMMFRAENDESNFTYGTYTAPYSRESLLEYALAYRAEPLETGELRMVVDMDGFAVGILDLYEIDAVAGHAFVSIFILPEYRRRGYALEALDLAARYASEILPLTSLGVRVAGNNKGSLALFRKAGYRECGCLRRWIKIPHAGGMQDVYLFQKLL